MSECFWCKLDMQVGEGKIDVLRGDTWYPAHASTYVCSERLKTANAQLLTERDEAKGEAAVLREAAQEMLDADDDQAQEAWGRFNRALEATPGPGRAWLERYRAMEAVCKVAQVCYDWPGRAWFAGEVGLRAALEALKNTAAGSGEEQEHQGGE